jgi:hypothetical protein
MRVSLRHWSRPALPTAGLLWTRLWPPVAKIVEHAGFSLVWALKDLDTVDASAYAAGLLVVVIASMKRIKEEAAAVGREIDPEHFGLSVRFARARDDLSAPGTRIPPWPQTSLRHRHLRSGPTHCAT